MPPRKLIIPPPTSPSTLHKKYNTISVLKTYSLASSMEKASPVSLSHSFSLVGTVGLLFTQIILSWVVRFHKLSWRFVAFFQSQARPLSFLHEEQATECNTTSHSEEEIKLSREEVAMVMGRMGLHCSQEGEQLKEFMGFDELSNLFEDQEPSLEEVKLAFRVFDENSDGFIDAEELQRALAELGFREGLTVSECACMIAVYDENKDRRIDFKEFFKLMEGSFC